MDNQPRPTYDPRQLDITNKVLTEEMEDMRSKVLMRLAKEFNIFDAPDTLRNIKKLAESNIVFNALQDYTNRKFPVITLCGSVKRVPREIWDKKAQELSLDNWVVMTVNVWGLHEYLHNEKDKKASRIKEDLDISHKQKILMSNAIYVLNYKGYIGKSTRSEIEFASAHGKIIHFLEDLGDG